MHECIKFCSLIYTVILIIIVTLFIAYLQTIQGTVSLFIKVEDYDLSNPDDHVDNVYATITLTPSSSFTSIRTYNGIYGNSRIELSFRLQCSSNFYGSDCATYCVPRDDSGGHYSCGTNGQRICLSGWSGPSNNCLTRELIGTGI